MKKTAVAAGMVAFGLACGAIGAGASTGLVNIKAVLNNTVTFSVDGQSWKPDNAPITYNNTTYIALRDAAEVLGVGIGWNQAAKQVSISSDGSAPANTGSTSNSGSTPSAGSSVDTSSVVTYSTSTSETAAAEQLKETALKAMIAYGRSLAAGNTTAFNEFIDKYVDDQKLSSLSDGRAYSKDDFAEVLPGLLESNTSSTITDYSNAVRGASVNDLEVGSTYTGSLTSSFYYSFSPSGWTATSTASIQLSFVLSDDEKKWVLSSVTVY